MSFNSPVFSKYENKDFGNYRLGLIKSSWNKQITDLLYNSSFNFLIESGIKEKNIFFNKSLVTISPQRVNQIISKIKEKEGPSSSSEVTPSEIKNIISNRSTFFCDICQK